MIVRCVCMYISADRVVKGVACYYSKHPFCSSFELDRALKREHFAKASPCPGGGITNTHTYIFPRGCTSISHLLLAETIPTCARRSRTRVPELETNLTLTPPHPLPHCASQILARDLDFKGISVISLVLIA